MFGSLAMLEKKISNEAQCTQGKLTGPWSLRKWDPNILSSICRPDRPSKMQNRGLANRTNQSKAK